MKTKDRKRQIRVRILMIVLILVIAAAALLWRRYSPSREVMDPKTYFENAMSSDGTEQTLKENELAVVLNDAVISQKAKMDGDSLYLSYELVRDRLNGRFYWDEGNSQIIFTTPTQTYEIPVNSTAYTIDGEEQTYDRTIIFSDSDDLWMSADFVKEYTNMTYQNEADTYHVLIRSEWGTVSQAECRKDAKVRCQGGIKSPILTTVSSGDTVTVLETMDRWSRVLTPDGFIGYLRNSEISDPHDVELVNDFTEPEYTSITSDQKINLAWHMVTSKDANQYFSSVTENAEGLNVISPTWFSLTDNEGNFSSLAEKSYVRKAHKKGYQVWALVDNFSADMSTTSLMASTSARRNLAANLMEAVEQYDLDGINIDFESLSEDAQYSYVQFMRELSILCRKNGTVLSVDVPVTYEFNTFYNRKELGTVCDYVIVMGYDEHYYGSEAGSVASLSFEEEGIKNALEEVPASKLISGVPFYTRLWFTSADGSATDSQIVSMSTVYNTMESWGVYPSWDEETQQNFVTWDANGTTASIWIEDKYSLALKANLVSEYDLGGIAAWALTFETDDVWQAISDGISGNVNVEETIAAAKAANEELARATQTEEAATEEAVTEEEAAKEAVTEEAATEEAAGGEP